MNRLAVISCVIAVIMILCAAGCADWAPHIAQVADGPAISDQSVQAVRDLTAALASFEETHITGGDFIQNDPWMVVIVGLLLVLSPYICGKMLWLLMGKAAHLLTTPRAARALGGCSK